MAYICIYNQQNMPTSIFDSIVFGPVKSRRLGVSLGVNLLPADGKICSFNCIYCECGLNRERKTHNSFPELGEVKSALSDKLSQMKSAGEHLDVITFAGNGEPTLHPRFSEAINMVIELRDRFFPDAKISVLSNATMLHKPEVVAALLKVENNIQKLDGADDETVRLLDAPNSPDFSLAGVVEQLKAFNGKVIIQTIFVKGEIGGRPFTNSDDAKVEAWLQLVKEIAPRQVMIYTIDRPVPTVGIEKVSLQRLQEIGEKVKAAGFDVSIAG